jgi:hypothetical protein
MTGEQRKEIQDALAGAFEQAELDQLLSLELDRDRQRIVADGPRDDVVLKLIQIAEREGWLGRLVSAAHRKRPDNPKVSAVARKYGAAPCADVPFLLPHDCDRKEQKIELSKALQRLRQLGRRRPLVCVVHGEPAQCHEEFIDLFAERLLAHGLGLKETAKVTRYSPTWPAAARPAELAAKYREQLAYLIDPALPASLAEIARALDAPHALVLIDTPVDTDAWLGGAGALLKAFLCGWADWPALDPGPWLVVCLKVKYREYRFGLSRLNALRSFWLRRANNDMRRALQAAAVCPAGVGLVVLPELTAVGLDEALAWRTAVQEAKYCGNRNLIPDIEALFGRTRSPGKLPMRELADGLMRLLETCC